MPIQQVTCRSGVSPPSIGLLLSGGIDSAIMLATMLELDRSVVPFYVSTGCVWEDSELLAARDLIRALGQAGLGELVELDMPLADLYDDHWSVSGKAAPERGTDDDAVYLPGRNPLLLLKPALWCQMHGIGELALATLAGNPFDDATPDFFASFEAMLRKATGDTVKIVRPFEHLSKREVMQLRGNLPLELTFSCLSPIDGLHCGRCNKCAERQAAFRQVDAKDPTRYAELVSTM